MGTNSGLDEVLKKYDIQVERGLSKLELNEKNGKLLYRVEGWKEITESGLMNAICPQ